MARSSDEIHMTVKIARDKCAAQAGAGVRHHLTLKAV